MRRMQGLVICNLNEQLKVSHGLNIRQISRQAQIPKRDRDNRHFEFGKCISNPLASSLGKSSINYRTNRYL
jgi:hypothetical protein